MPFSMTSAESSGGVTFSTSLSAAMSPSSSCWMASVTSSDVTAMMRGRPVTMSRPFTSIASFSLRYMAEPMVILMSSAVRSPMARPYLRRMNSWMAASNLLPPMRTDADDTMPPSEMTAASMVPPPMSMIMWPDALPIGMSAPMAATIGSLMMYAARAPARMVASMTARRSVDVMPPGTATMTSGRKSRAPPRALLMK